jgi:hypothetical protein
MDDIAVRAESRNHTIISRAEARRLGLNRYFTGKPCAHGHVAERRISGRSCIKCQIARAEAVRSLGLKRFFTGVPCPEGHLAERFIRSGICVVCGPIKNRQWVADHPQEARQHSSTALRKLRESATTASISPAANALVIVSVSCGLNGGTIPTVTGVPVATIVSRYSEICPLLRGAAL